MVSPINLGSSVRAALCGRVVIVSVFRVAALASEPFQRFGVKHGLNAMAVLVRRADVVASAVGAPFGDSAAQSLAAATSLATGFQAAISREHSISAMAGVKPRLARKLRRMIRLMCGFVASWSRSTLNLTAT
jgi:hypothetical protein